MSDLNFDKEILDSMDDDIKELIKRWNDLVCNLSFASEGVKSSYSQLYERAEELEKQNKSYEERIKEIEEENKKLKEERKVLEMYKEAYENFTSKVFALSNEEQNKEFK